MTPNIKFNVTDQYAIILTHKQPFADWLNFISDDLAEHIENVEDKVFTIDKMLPSVYMFDELVESDEIEIDLPHIAVRLFERELDNWTNDLMLRPREKTYELFCEWFDVKISMLVWNVKEGESIGAERELTEDQTNCWPAKHFHDKMLGYLEEYKDYLLHIKSDGSLASSGDIVHQFINFLFSNLIIDIDQITIAMVRSMFYGEIKKIEEKFISKEELKKILRGFFDFLDGKHQIRNEKIMKGLSEK